MIDKCALSMAPNRTKLDEFSCWYSDIHGYISVIVCAFGILANALNIIILTRKNMRTSTNAILTGLAISDLLTMASYAPFVYHFHLTYGTKDSPERNTKHWMSFKVFNALFTATTHTVSIWLGVVLSIFRYIYIRLSTEGQITCSMPRAKIAVIAVYCASILICIPNYCTMTISGMNEVHLAERNESYWVLQPQNNTSGFLRDMNIWTYAILAKIIPCLLMSLFGGLLLFSLHEAKKKGELLHQHSRISDSFRTRMKEHTRTTRMLVAVILLFLAIELPQGVLLVTSILKPEVYAGVYTPLGDLMDDLALLNNSINLIIYCTMSKAFRDNFLWLVCGWCKRKDTVVLFSKTDKEESL